MSERKFIIPEFGPLSGMRVVGAGSLIAMPFAASMLAEFGAEVIQIERPSAGDTYRTFGPLARDEDGACVGAAWIQEARNRLSMTLELGPTAATRTRSSSASSARATYSSKTWSGSTSSAYTTTSSCA